MSTNPNFVYDPQNIPDTQAGNYSPQASEFAHRLKKLYREAQETNRLLRLMCLMLMRTSWEHEGAFNLNHAAMLFDIEPRKQKKQRQRHYFWDDV